MAGRQLELDKFPACCGILVAGSTFVPSALLQCLHALSRHSKVASIAAYRPKTIVSIRFLTTFTAGLLSFFLLNYRRTTRKQLITCEDNAPPCSPGSATAFSEFTYDGLRPQQSICEKESYEPSPKDHKLFAGKTLDLTLFAFVRALDIFVSSVWSTHKSHYQFSQRRAVDASVVDQIAAPALFAVSSGVVMWSWFYTPHRLPASYNAWITSAAEVDTRLIQALRECHEGTFVYGKETGRASLLQGMCHDLGYPPAWGDPTKSIIPCELYHSGIGKSCEWHAATRFFQGWKFAMRMYLPLNLVIILRRKPVLGSLTTAIVEACRSSAFLGGFIALFYYGVCFARTRAGPRIFSRQTVTPQSMDGGICVGSGCFACGWSILLEKASRRQEIAFFVAPRALATMIPRRYDRRHLWREQLVFAMSVAVILTTAQTNPRRVRGVFGRLLAQVLH